MIRHLFKTKLNSTGLILGLWLSITQTPVLANTGYGFFENDKFTSSRFETIKKATAAVIRSDKLHANLFKMNEQYRYCFTQPFEEQRLWGNCSATLIASDVVLTAGHCIQNAEDCENLSFAFDFDKDSDIENLRAQNPKLIACKKLLYSSFPIPQKQFIDFALIQLKTPVTDREVIKLSQKTVKKDNLFSVGHPLGLPKKVASGYISEKDFADNQKSGKSFYRASLPTHPGLSGAGVYSAELEYIGILVRGAPNYEKDGRCMMPVLCETESCPWAEIQKLNHKKIKQVLSEKR